MHIFYFSPYPIVAIVFVLRVTSAIGKICRLWLQPVIGLDSIIITCCHGVSFESNNMPFAIYGLNSCLT